MTWNRRYQLKSYFRSALWTVPLVALLFEQVAGALAQTVDTRLAWEGLALGVTGAQAVLNAIITLTLSFIVFTFWVSPCGDSGRQRAIYAAHRILVDIAIKALSKAIKDPTTAVLAIDQLHRLLRSAGRRNLRGRSDPRSSRESPLARIPDLQGLGGASHAEQVSSIQIPKLSALNGEDIATARAKR